MGRFTIIFLLLVSSFEAYGRTVFKGENVRGKLYPRENRVEIGVGGGRIMNLAFVESYIVQSSLAYYLTETFALSVEGMFFINNDTGARYCLENFYNDPGDILETPCPDLGQDPETLISPPSVSKLTNVGPAYVPIREIQYLASLNLIWNPVYGKMRFFLDTTLHFDIFTTIGAGFADSIFYPASTTLLDGRLSRGDFTKEIGSADECPGPPDNPGVCPNDPNFNALIGVNGRPPFVQEIVPAATFGIGQKFHLFTNFHLTAEARNYTLFPPDGPEAYFMLWGGFVVRL